MFDSKARKIVKDMVITTLPKIKVESGVCRFNLKCHMNAVHDALNDGNENIAMCFYIDGDYPIIHFLNVDNEGKYIDNTLGRWSEVFDYYLVKTIGKEDFFMIDNIFWMFRNEIKRKLPWYIRLFSKYEF